MLTLNRLIINLEIMKLIRIIIYIEDVSKYRDNIFLLVNKQKKKYSNIIKKEKTINFKIFYHFSKKIFRIKITS